MLRSGHLDREDDIARIAALGVKAVRFPLLWELTAPKSVAHADWRWADARLAALRAHGIRPIVGLVHHGSGPQHTHLLDPHFAEKLATYAAAVARRYPWIEDFTPINEPLTTARFSALYGHWYPHARSGEAFLRALVNECRATSCAMEAIRAVRPEARLVQTEDFGHVTSTPHLAYQADFENERRWLSLDLISGLVDGTHPLYRWLRENGVTDCDFAFLRAHRTVPDVIGLNYYLTSERYLDERLALYPARARGGNEREAYADVEAVRVAPPLMGHEGALASAWERYRRPVALTEVHLGCTREEQLRWWRDAWDAAVTTRARGVDVRAVTAWALFGSHDWNSLLVDESGYYEPGAFDVRADPPRATAIARAVFSTATTGAFDHPVLDTDGWWRRPSRVQFGPGVTPPASPRATKRARPILLTGGTGTLGRAVLRLCEQRGLACVAPPRSELDITSPKGLANALDLYNPWAVINAAGYVRVDDAEADAARCWRTNVGGPRALAVACAERNLRLATFSSDLVFDGRGARPYTETDAPAPLNVYGASKAECERLVLEAFPQALVVRTSAFFGPWDEDNFVIRAVRALARRERFVAAHDLIVSPTYIPELVEWVLDLLIDDERGLWHLANEGAVSWFELAQLAAKAHGVPAETLAACDAGALGQRARRPRYSALTSGRGASLRSLDAALVASAHAHVAA